LSTFTHSDLVRQEMPATTAHIYLNTGTFGPLPRCVIDAMQQRMQEEWSDGRLGAKGFQSIADIYAQARHKIAHLLHTDPSKITLTDNTGEGMNIVIYGFNWQAGDEIITTNHEHIGALAPLYQIRDRFGVTLRVVDLGPRAELPAATAIQPLITPRTRLIVLSHVTWSTGTVLDVNAVGEMAHTHHIPVLVDGAQSAGNIAVDVTALDIDFYAVPMQKWLCGPDGTGALYIHTPSFPLISPTYVGYYSLSYEEGFQWKLRPDARRFEVGGRQSAAIAGQAAVLTWLETVVGYEWIYARISSLNLYAYNALKDLPGVAILTPQSGTNGLLSFTLQNHDAAGLVRRLQSEHNILIRSIPDNNALRISTGFYNTEEEIDELVHALKKR
jgi:L-cysteine/cystine lyase